VAERRIALAVFGLQVHDDWLSMVSPVAIGHASKHRVDGKDCMEILVRILDAVKFRFGGTTRVRVLDLGICSTLVCNLLHSFAPSHSLLDLSLACNECLKVNGI
jgi:hypothetical protein